MICTTLNKIRAAGPCERGWRKLLKGLGKTEADDAPLPFATILKINGLYDALWCCRTVPGHDREWRLYAVWCARRVEHLMTDSRSKAALDVAERYANGEATEEELRTAAASAAWASAAASAAAWEASRAAWEAAAWAASAAWASAEAAARAAEAALAARAAVRAAVRDAERQAQAARFLEVVSEIPLPAPPKEQP